MYSRYKIAFNVDGKQERHDYYCADLTKEVACIAIIRRFLKVPWSKSPQLEEELLNGDTFYQGKRISDVNFIRVSAMTDRAFNKWNSDYDPRKGDNKPNRFGQNVVQYQNNYQVI